MRLTKLWIGMLALSGVVFAHALAYLAHAPDPSVRTALLETTGHSRFWLAGAVAFASVIAGVSGLFVERMRAARLRGTTDEAFSAVVVRLSGLQVLGFLLLEVAERLSVGGDAVGVLSEPVVLLGVLAQIIVAFVGAFIIKLVTVVALHVVSRADERAQTTRTAVPPPSAPTLLSRIACDTRSSRGPPVAIPL